MVSEERKYEGVEVAIKGPGRLYRLPKELTYELAKTPMKQRQVFEELERWRRKSMDSRIRI